jgi:hypothetical protein
MSPTRTDGRRLSTPKTALLAAVGAALITATSAAPASGADSGRTVTVYEHQTEFNAVDNPPAGPSVGDSFALSSDLYTDSTQTTKVGHAGVACTQDSITHGPAGEVICTFSVLLADGQMTAAGLVDLAGAITPGGSFTMPIVGGTSHYEAAKGEVSVRVINATDSIDQFVLR